MTGFTITLCSLYVRRVIERYVAVFRRKCQLLGSLLFLSKKSEDAQRADEDTRNKSSHANLIALCEPDGAARGYAISAQGAGRLRATPPII
jgi:hypothetical protein